MKEKIIRLSIPGRVYDLLWSDDEFYRDVTSHKKVSTAGSFPKVDQWCDDEGFRMAFALAGYAPDNVRVQVCDNELIITGTRNKNESELDLGQPHDESSAEDEYPVKTPNLRVQQGIIVRGIARRNFKTKYFINSSFNLQGISATMQNGLLEILIPKKEDSRIVDVKIRSEND